MILNNHTMQVKLNFTEVQNFDTKELSIYKSLRENAFSADNSFIADSPKVVNKLLEGAVEVKSILATSEYYEEFEELLLQKKIPTLYLATKEMMQNIVGHKIHHNVMMHAIRPKENTLETLGEQIIMLDEITSTQNIGSIARSAAALGVDSYVVPKQGPHPYARRAMRVSMGYTGKLKIHTYDDIITTIQTLQTLGYHVFAAEVTEDATMLSQVEVPQKWILLMGHEGKGISQDILNVCDEVVSIEMQEGVKSFNVAVAASIMMYQFKNRV